ncbi:MAG TPA: ADOP family duplicated permease [Gemmatimonadaceae bacterium]|nr:ADOP family duplicated permease [Gemmatimonadaceae bacterium]
MRRIPGLRRVFRFPWRSRAEIGDDVDAEIAFHIDSLTQELVAEGMAPADARAEALRRFGDVTRYRAECRSLSERHARAVRLAHVMEGVRYDFRHALRGFARTPTFTLAAALTLALGVGATSATFGVVKRLVLAPLPFPEGERMIFLWRTADTSGGSVGPSSRLVDAWSARSRTLEWVEPFTDGATLLLDGEPAEVRTGYVTPRLARRLGVRPLLGRGFVAEDTVSGARVALLSEGLWRARFGSAPDVVGRVLRLEEGSYTVAGVMPARFAAHGDLGRRVDIWLPLQPDTARVFVRALALPRRGVAQERVMAELDAIAASMAVERDGPEGTSWHTMVMRPGAGPGTRKSLFLLFGAVVMVLVIACANVASLLLARAAARGHELSVRAMLGARRGRLVRQALTESLLLALLGGAGGVFMARALLAALRALRPDSMPELDAARLDPAGVALALGLALLTGLLFGVAPAVSASRAEAGAALGRTGSGGVRSSRLTKVRFVLVAGQVALSTTLLTAAGLLVRTVVNLHRSDPGFDPSPVLAARLQLPRGRYTSEAARVALYDEVLARLRRTPGVRGASIALGAPPDATVMFGELQAERGEAPAAEGVRILVGGMVDSAYFRTLGIPLRAGRIFSGAHGEAVIGATLARTLWPGESAIGKRLRLGPKDEWLTVAGVVDDVAAMGPDTRRWRMQLYQPWLGSFQSAVLLIRADGDPRALVPAVRAAVAAADSSIPLPLLDVETMTSRMRGSISRERFRMALLASFAGLALLLSAVGLYGVIAYAVSQRSREIGIRIALGARPSGVRAMVVLQGMRAAGTGLVIGLAAALAAARLLEGLVFGVPPRDPATLVVVAVLIGVVAWLAAYLPARHAARVDPVAALRSD